MIQRHQRLLLRTRYAPKTRTAMMMPAAIHWSPGFGKRLKLGIMAQRLYLGCLLWAVADTHPVQSGLSRMDTRSSVTRRLRKRVRTLTDCAWRRLLLS